MAYRIYITPITGSGTSTDDPRRPQFFDGLEWGGMDFGAEPLMIVGADLSAADDTFVTAQAGVQALPFDLTQTLSAGAVTTVGNWLEARSIPGDWLTTSITYGQLAKFVAALFGFLQAFSAIRGTAYVRMFGGAVTLNSTFGSLSANARTDLAAAAAQLGYSTAGITGSTTIRAALKILANQAQGHTFILGPGTV